MVTFVIKSYVLILLWQLIDFFIVLSFLDCAVGEAAGQAVLELGCKTAMLTNFDTHCFSPFYLFFHGGR